MRIFDLAREHAVIGSVDAAIGWDQETNLPAAAATYRAAQLSWLSAKAHELATSDTWRRALEEAEAAAD